MVCLCVSFFVLFFFLGFSKFDFFPPTSQAWGKKPRRANTQGDINFLKGLMVSLRVSFFGLFEF